MSYVALYRKYRSQSFDELMGQEAVTTVLRNSLASGRFGHAYLFYGARGCGKTSTARLLARALNCVAQDGPTPSPCGTCRLCVAIRDGACMDVIEMDAASETGIDDVREKVIENVQYAPGEARYKVYIIDEVHDLSSKAFDALLKTLEEPPAHVVFVLATTEYLKVPITIRSRCQGFQFKRGTLKDLGASVERVIKAEGYRAEPEAIEAIARSAEGSWRDALSILEQVLAYSDGHVTADTVHRAVGTVGLAELARVTEILVRGDIGDAIDAAGDLLDRGTDARQLLTALQGHVMDLMLLTAGAKRAAREFGPDRLALLQPQTGLFTPAVLLAMSSELSAGEREVRFSNHHRWILERTLARVQSIAQGALPATTAVAAPTLKTDAAKNGAAARATPVTAPLAATPALVPKPPLTHSVAPVTEMPDEEEPPVEVVKPNPEPAPVGAARNGATEPEPATGGAAVAPASHFADEVTLEVIQRAWPRILKLIEKTSPPAKNFLDKAQVKALEGKLVTLTFQETFARDRIQTKGKDLVEKKINEGLKTEGYKIVCVMEGQGGGGTAVGQNVPTPAPSGGSEMERLLDAPTTPTATGPARIMDFEMPAASPPPRDAGRENAAREGAVREESVREPPATRGGYGSPPPAVSEPPAGTGLLAETLNIFGGEVVKSEPITPH
jgi:DNA polymerase-3 subunit gamma/tau